MTIALHPAPHGAAPPVAATLGHNRISDREATRLVDAFTEILIGERSTDTPCFLDSIIAKANPHKDLGTTEPDVILSDLFLFRADLLPKFDNTICAELGRLAEKLVSTLFSQTCGYMVRTDEALMEGFRQDYEASPLKVRKPGGASRTIKWKRPDFEFARSALVEVKYRFNSYQNKTEQIEAAHVYRSLGYRPVFLHISPDCQQIEDFKAAGWEVHVGEDALAYIEDKTGIDFRAILSRVAGQPVIQARLMDGQDAILDRLSSQVLRDIDFGIDEVKETIYAHLAGDDRHTLEILRRRSDIDPDLVDEIRRKTEDGMNERIGNLPDLDDHIDKIKEITGIFDTLDEDQQNDALSRLAARLDDRRLDAFIATCG